MKVVFDNLANFLSISPNQTPVFAVCLPGPSWTFLHILVSSHPVLSPILYMFSHPHVQYSMWSSAAVIILLQLYTCFLIMRGPNTHPINFEWYRQKLLAGKLKVNSQIFNEDFYLPLYLPLWCLNMRLDCGFAMSWKVRSDRRWKWAECRLCYCLG